MKHVRLLPLLILVSALTFTIRLGDFMAGLSRSGAAMAQQEVTATPPPLPVNAADQNKPADAAPAADAKTADAKPAAIPPPVMDPAHADSAATDRPDTMTAEKWKDPGDMALEDSKVKADLYRDLAKRRDDLDKKAKELNVREALLKAGEKEVDQKLQQLTEVRNEIKELLKTQSDEEKARTDSLVKIYEIMKPDDAARIFNTLDMDVVMKVIANMSERKSGPVIAAMNPERARQVTQLLAQQKRLPELPPQN
jgi:flagellar motility protein MotE (MotC chaperone)